MAVTLPPTQPPAPIRFGAFEVNLWTAELRKHGRKLRVEGQPFEVLRLLLAHPGQLVTRDDLKQRLWPADTFVDFETGINAAVKRLRQALGDSADTPRFIETLPRRGYRFIHPIIDSELPTPADAGSPKGRWRLAPALLGLLVLGGVTMTPTVVDRSRANLTIVVLPLENLTGDRQQEYLVNGLHDDLLTHLAAIDSLHVIQRASVKAFANPRESVPTIARALHADAVVEGEVRRAGELVLLTLRVSSADQDDHLWAHAYQADLRDIQLTPAEAALAIARRLRVHVSPEANRRLSGTKVVDPAAYEAFLKGRHQAGRWTNTTAWQAIQHFHDAINIDPTYALAWAWMGNAYQALGSFAARQNFTQEEALRAAQVALERAIERDPRLRAPHQTLGRMKLAAWDWAGAKREFDEAQRLDPSWEGPLTYFMATGRFDDAVAAARRGAELDPFNYASQLLLGWTLFMAHRFDESIIQLNKTIDLEPRNPNGYYELAWSLARKGRHEEAVRACDTSLALKREQQPETVTVAGCGWVYALAGRRRQALEIAAALDEDDSAEGGLIHRAHIYDALGDRDGALAALAQAYDERAPHLPNQWFSPMVSEGLRADPRFQELVRRTGDPWVVFPPPAIGRK